MSDYGTNPASAYSFQTSAFGNISGSHSADAGSETDILSTILGLGTLFSLNTTEYWDAGVPKMTVQFQSPLISQPIFASDFIASPNGTFSLDPAYRDVVIPFTIPAGIAPNFGISRVLSSRLCPSRPASLPQALGSSGLLDFPFVAA